MVKPQFVCEYCDGVHTTNEAATACETKHLTPVVIEGSAYFNDTIDRWTVPGRWRSDDPIANAVQQRQGMRLRITIQVLPTEG